MSATQDIRENPVASVWLQHIFGKKSHHGVPVRRSAGIRLDYASEL